MFSSRTLKTGSAISDHDRLGGVVQASPGIENTEVSASGFVVPAAKALLRFKVFDDPAPHPDTNGLVQFIVEFRNLRAFLPETRETPDSINLTIAKIEVKKKPAPKPPGHSERPWLKGRDSDILVVQPDPAHAAVRLVRGHGFAAVIKGLSLPAGNYEWLRITFVQSGIVEVGDNDYRAFVADSRLTFEKPFAVVAGKITALHSKPEHDFDRETGHLRSRRHPDFHPVCQTNRIYPVRFHLDEGSITVKDPIQKLYLSISQVRLPNQILNDVRTVIELLELRAGSVALLGHNMISPGTYSMFQIILAGEHKVVDSDGEHPLKIFEGNESTMQISGPFDLRGGRITELFLEFDPNTCIFYTNDGYVLDPEIRVASVLSMTSDQENRIVQALGPKTNLVADAAETVLEGTVQTAQAYADRIPRTRAEIRIDDRLRGVTPATTSIELSVPGGSINGLKLRVYGMPQFASGERAIFFLKRIGNGYGVVEGEYGKVNL